MDNYQENAWNLRANHLFFLVENPDKRHWATRPALINKFSVSVEAQNGEATQAEAEALAARIHQFLATPAAPAAVEAARPFLNYLFEWLEDEAAKMLSEEAAHEWRANEMNGQFDDTFDAAQAHGRGQLAATLRTAIAAELLKHSAAALAPPAAPAADALADLVSRFSAALLEKLQAARLKYGYEADGFLANDWQTECLGGLLCHVDKGDPRDVAAYCAFMWHHRWSTTPTPTILEMRKGFAASLTPPAAGAATEAAFPKQVLIPGIPRLAAGTKQEFLARLGDGAHRKLWWLEDYTLDSHGDESQASGWHTCKSEQGYPQFFRPWKGKAITHYLSEVPAAPTQKGGADHA